MIIEQLVFYAASIVAIFAGLMMILSANPVHAALYLVLTFVASAFVWMLLEAEFLALVLVFVYVGAVMTLFLFVVMMLNLDFERLRRGFVRYLPVGLLVVGAMVALLIFVVAPESLGLQTPAHRGPDYSNIKELGSVLYTQHVLAFELAAVLLLVAIISAITLSHRPSKDRKVQQPDQQVRVKREDRVELVKMPAEKKS